MAKKRKTIEFDCAIRASGDLRNWPTREADLALAGDILARHQEKYGVIKFFEICEINEQEETVSVVFPPWIHELETRLESIHGEEQAEIVFNKIIRWLVRKLRVDGVISH